jgi:hypothetical protein
MNEVNRTLAVGWHHRIGESSDINIKPFLWKTRAPRWGRQVRRIAWAYFTPSRSVLPLTWLAAMVLMSLFSVRLSILLSFWNNGFYSAMQSLDAKEFWSMLFVFVTLASVESNRISPGGFTSAECEVTSGWNFSCSAASVQRSKPVPTFPT